MLCLSHFVKVLHPKQMLIQPIFSVHSNLSKTIFLTFSQRIIMGLNYASLERQHDPNFRIKTNENVTGYHIKLTL